MYKRENKGIWAAVHKQEYYYRKLQQYDNIDMSESQQGSRTKQITSQFEGYLGAIPDQEIQTKFPFLKRQIDYVKYQQQIINAV